MGKEMAFWAGGWQGAWKVQWPYCRKKNSKNNTFVFLSDASSPQPSRGCVYATLPDFFPSNWLQQWRNARDSLCCTRWGGQLWTKMGFSMYKPSWLIEAYGGPEKYWLVCVGLLVNHLINLNSIFLSDGVSAAAEWAAGLADVFCH